MIPQLSTLETRNEENRKALIKDLPSACMRQKNDNCLLIADFCMEISCEDRLFWFLLKIERMNVKCSNY
jgi:hypothetical protein